MARARVAKNKLTGEFLFLSVALLVLVADQISKFLVKANMTLGDSIPKEGLVRLTYTTNSGGVFGLFADQTFPLIITAFIGVSVLLIYYRFLPWNSGWPRASLGLILGGAIGNLVDRIYFGKVTDFIDIRVWGDFHWPAFNLADSAITIGIIILICFLFLKGREEKASHGKEA